MKQKKEKAMDMFNSNKKNLLKNVLLLKKEKILQTEKSLKSMTNSSQSADL